MEMESTSQEKEETPISNPDEDENVTLTLMDLPREVRVQMLKFLPTEDLRRMRLVSQTLRMEIDTAVGLHVNLEGPNVPYEAWDLWSLSEYNKRRKFSLGGSLEPDHVAENMKWISSSNVYSLTVRQTSGLSCDPLVVITNPFVLHRLFLEVDDNPKTGSSTLLEMLSVYNSLRVLGVSFSIPDPYIFAAERSHWTTIVDNSEYYEFYRKFTADILGTLVTKPDLKEFSIEMEIDNMPYGVLENKADPDSNDQIPIYPSTVHALNICLPDFLNAKDWIGWKALLDQQTQLRDLKVWIGFPFWKFFMDVMHKNQETLMTIDLHLSSLKEDPVSSLNIDSIEKLDLSILLPNLTKLTSLKLAMTQGTLMWSRPLSHLSTNIGQIQLESLETLDLHFVHLVAADFTHIFQEVPNLKNVSIFYWSGISGLTPLVVDDAASEAITAACQPLSVALIRQKLESVYMKDETISRCPRALNEAISNSQHYWVSWTEMEFSYGIPKTTIVLRINKIGSL